MPEQPPKTSKALPGAFKAVFSWVIFPVIVVLILHNFVFQAYHVVGSSMEPTLQSGDYLIISKLDRTAHLFGGYMPERGQIIVFHYPADPRQVFIKRVIALPGERIRIQNGSATVFNKDHPDGFDPDTGYEPKGTITFIDTDQVVQPDEVFVMGDNRLPGASSDSRDWGQLPMKNIIGEAKLRLLPLDNITVL